MQPTGYTYDSDVYCLACLPTSKDNEEVGAIFGWEEWDYPLHCSVCEAFFPVSLTSDGREYVREALAANDGRPEILAIWRDAYESSL